MHSRNPLRLAVVGLAFSLAATAATAQSDYPARPVTFLIPQAVGGSTDTIARIVAQRLADGLGQQVVTENRAGANGIIGSEIVAKAPANGYMFLIGGTGTMAINQSLYNKLPYDPVKNFTPVAIFGYSTSVLVVHPSETAKTIGELVAQIKAKPPGTFRYASAGVGSSPHLTAEMFKQMSGTDVLHVPYKGSTPGVTATMAGEVNMMFTGVASALGGIKGGRLRALSITGPSRTPALPDVPTANESGLPGFEADFWIGLFAPAGTPRPIVTRLNAEVNKILNAADLKARYESLGIVPFPRTPEQFGEILNKDIDRWAKAVKGAGIKPE